MARRGDSSRSRHGRIKRPAAQPPARLAGSPAIDTDLKSDPEFWLDQIGVLEATLDRYVTLYRDAPIGCVTLDEKGIVLELNEMAASFLGVVGDYAVGKPMLCYVHPRDAHLMLSHLNRCARGEATTELRLRPLGSRRNPDNDRPVQLLSRHVWLPNARGSVYHTVINDLTAQRRAEQALRLSEKRHREIVETANEGICIVDHLNAIVLANRRLAVLVGASREELIGRSAYELLLDEDVTAARAAFERRDAGAGGQMEQRLRRLDGSFVWTSVSTTVLHDDNGNFAGMLRMYTDTTAKHHVSDTRESLVRQLVDAQERERQRIARELHDQLGQHVVALSLGLAQLAQLVGGDTEMSEAVIHLRKTADLLGRDVHTLAFELRPAALDHLGLSVALSSYAEQVGARSGLDIDVHCDIPVDVGLTPEQETGIYRIAQEALSNVVKHAEARRASVILEQRGNVLQLIVEDDGVGFDQLSGPPRSSDKLGLAGMKERAALLCGTATVESSPGRGTSVYARIPLGVHHANRDETSPAAAR